MSVMFGSYGLAFQYGNVLILNGEKTAGDVLAVFFAIMIGGKFYTLIYKIIFINIILIYTYSLIHSFIILAFSIGNAAPYMPAVGASLGAAAKIYKIIDRVPKIDSSDDKGKKIVKSDFKGLIEFKMSIFLIQQDLMYKY